MSENIDDKYKEAVKIVNSAGISPFPVTDKLVEILTVLVDILKHLLKEDEVDFIFAFKRRKSQTMEQLKKSSKLSEQEILEKTNILAKKGVISDQPNRYGVMVYKLLSFVRIFEVSFMRDLEPSDYNKKLANLYAKAFDELAVFFQEFYDFTISMTQSLPPITRTLPILVNRKSQKKIQININEELEVPVEKILPTQKVEEIIEKFDDIAVGNCYCRHHRDLLDDLCKIDAPRKTCLTFGKAARHTSKQGFARLISKDEALIILQEAEEAGLIHRTWHANFAINNDVIAICNCCICCCVYSLPSLILPYTSANNYLAKVNLDLCKGSGICVEKCHYEAIQLNIDKKVEIKKENCIGCGLCASFCPEGAISMLEGLRVVKIIPPRRT